jgi:hypothetical protein
MAADDATDQRLAGGGKDPPRYGGDGRRTLRRPRESPQHSHPRWPFWLVALGAGLTLGACSASGQVPATPMSATAVSATPTPNSLQGPVGTPFTYKDATGNVMTVSLIGVTYAPQGTADQSPGIGYRFVGAKFKIVGISGTSSGDANSDASLIPVLSDTQTYRPDVSGVITGCSNFNGGSYMVTAGQTSIGCVVFTGPWDDRWARIVWRSGAGGTPATWDLPNM